MMLGVYLMTPSRRCARYIFLLAFVIFNQCYCVCVCFIFNEYYFVCVCIFINNILCEFVYFVNVTSSVFVYLINVIVCVCL